MPSSPFLSVMRPANRKIYISRLVTSVIFSGLTDSANICVSNHCWVLFDVKPYFSLKRECPSAKVVLLANLQETLLFR